MNGLISRYVLSFVVASLLALLVPLLDDGGGEPLVGVVDRGSVFVIYTGFLLVFQAFLLPAFIARDPERGRVWSWLVLTACQLGLAAIPLLLAAWIAGVSFDALLVAIGWIGVVTGAVLAGARLVGPKVLVPLTALAGGAFLFALPLALLYLESVGRPAPDSFVAWSPFHRMHALGGPEQPPAAWPFLAVAALLGLGALWPRRRPGGGLPGAATVLAVLGAGGALGLSSAASRPAELPVSAPAKSFEEAQVVQPELHHRLGGWARPGLRTPVEITLPAGSGDHILSLGGSATRIPGDGDSHRVLITPQRSGSAPQLAPLERPGELRNLETPYQLLPAERILVIVIGEAADAQALSQRLRGIRERGGVSPAVLPLTPAQVPVQAGALDAVDGFVLLPGARGVMSDAVTAALDRAVGYGALGLELQGERSRAYASGTWRAVRLEELAAAVTTLRRNPGAATGFDPTLVRTFAPPGWQEYDLSRVILFAVGYHLAVLAVFLLPLLLDSRKALGVYLSSVSFVVILVVLGAHHLLGRFFLTDNQVYTHQMSLLVLDPDDPERLTVHQLLCFASMSGEVRDLDLPRAEDLEVVRDRIDRSSGVLSGRGEERRLEGAILDRAQRRVMLRARSIDRTPFVLRGDGAATPFLLKAREPRDAAALERVRSAHIVTAEGIGGRLRPLSGPEGELVLEAEGDHELGMEARTEALLRKLIGRHALAPTPWLVIEMEGQPRPDDTRDYFWARDLGSFLVWPLPVP